MVQASALWGEVGGAGGGGGTSALREGRGALVYYSSLVQEMADGRGQIKGCGFSSEMNKMTTSSTKKQTKTVGGGRC